MASPQLGGLNSSQGKNFFNAANDFQKPSSKARIESRKGVLSRKSNINKNSFYRSKAQGKLPEYLPNKPTVVGSRGGIQGSSPGYYKKGGPATTNKLPTLGSGVAGNFSKSPILGRMQNNESVKPYGNPSAYQPAYQDNTQGAQGSIGSSGGLRGPSQDGGNFMLPSVSNKQAYGAMMSRGKNAPGSKGANNGLQNIYGAGVGSRSGKPGVGSLNSGSRRPPAMVGSSVAGAGYSSKSPYMGPASGSQ